MMQTSKEMQNNIILVLLVIGLSYVFTISHSSLDPQMGFIFLALTLLIIYKFMNDKNCPSVVSEGFQEEFQKINSFIRNVDNISDDVSIDHPDISALKSDAAVIKNSLEEIKSKMSALETKKLEDKRAKIDYDRAELSGVGVVQALQNEQIDELENKISIVKQMIKDRELEDVSRTYPKIPVYSSCIVSNAGGDYSVDEKTEDDMVSSSTNVAGGSYSTSGTWTKMMDKSGTSDISSSGSQGQQRTSAEDTLVQFLKGVAKQGINISIP